MLVGDYRFKSSCSGDLAEEKYNKLLKTGGIVCLFT